ncbi:MAG TPA: HD domain-containing protein [Phycisphaerales bacterium]|nr:HD domain-containing protein [Phycisphaerales bacterium]
MTSAPSSTSRSQRRYIKDMGAPEFVRGLFSVANLQLGQTRQGKPYLKCIVGDSSGEMPGRMWSIDEPTYKRLPTDGFVYIEGETQPYGGELQMIIHAIEVAEPTAEEMQELLPVTQRDVGQMFAEVTQLLGTLKHPAAQALAKAYLGDEYLMDAFRRAPAAKSMHHAFLGGLLEHTLTLMQIADRICPLYPKINRDLVILGLFLHDLGKTRELVFDRAFGYSDRGELIGHIVDGAIMLHDKSQVIMREQGIRFPAGFITVLQHIILSHHGEPEFGAAKIPSTPEAIMINLIDNLDAKTVMSVAAARPERTNPVEMGGNFTEKQWALNGAKLYKKDPLA